MAAKGSQAPKLAGRRQMRAALHLERMWVSTGEPESWGPAGESLPVSQGANLCPCFCACLPLLLLPAVAPHGERKINLEEN